MGHMPSKHQTQEDSNYADSMNENIQAIVELHQRAENEQAPYDG